MFKRGTKLAACLITAAAISSAARADCTFQPMQDVDVFSTHWNDALFYNYNTMASSVAGPVFGHRSASYAAPKEQWLGAFLYDYALQAYVEAIYSNVDRF